MSENPTENELGQEISDDLWVVLQSWIQGGAGSPACGIGIGLTAAKLLAAMENTLEPEEQEAGMDHIKAVALATYGTLRSRILNHEKETRNERETETSPDPGEDHSGPDRGTLRH